ncbi:hypothetical protein LXL04_007912 [Taraxacum kok-saghyz]
MPLVARKDGAAPRFNQGRWVPFVFNIEKKRGIHDTDQEMGNEIVIKKLGWIEEGEFSKLVEKGEVFGMKGTLELRTILFQEGEDDPNGVKLNSDLKQAREFVTKHDEVARDQDGLGCGEAIWVTCHLFYQAWKYFKWRDKTGRNRDKGAWERYFGQGLKIMHVSCVLGFIQQLWDTMAWSNPDFLNAIRRVFRTLQDEDDGKGRKHFPRQGESRADYKAREGAHEIHEFKGGTNPERYMEWERMIEHVIELQGLDDKKSFELAILQLKGNASPWFKRLKAKRSLERKEKISSCEVNSESEIEEEEVIIDTNLVMEALLPQMVQEEAGPRGKNKEMAPQPLSLEEKCSRESKQQDMPSPTLLACDEEVVSRLSVGRMVRVSKGKEGCAWSKPIKGLFTSNKECVLAAPKLLVEKGLLVPNHEHKTILGGGLKSTIMNCIDHDKTQTWALVSWLNMFGAVERDEGTLHVYKGKNEGGNADLGAPSIVACPRWTKCVWQGLNRRVFSKNSGYILTTPKLVPSSFSHCFKLRMLAGFVCLMAILAIRGLWLDGKGFKIDMEEENVVLDWLARGRHALGQSLMKGIKWDAILTFLLNNSLHRFNQGRWVHFVFNIEKKRWGLLLKDVLISSLKGRARGMFGVTKTQGLIKKDWSQVNCSKEMVGARGIHDTDQEMGNEIVIKKLGWIEERESSKLVEKGEVFGMKGTLELRTILFQEGEDDPNGVKLNSDLKQAREFVTKHDEVARDQDGLGCGEAIWVTCHLFYQAWKYFKWRDKTGWNRDKGAWERYFGQGLKIMHVYCVLGFIQQLWDTMAWSNPDFLNAIRRVFRTLQDEDDGKGRKHFPRHGESRADYKAREGAHEIHEFKGGTNPERYMEWERMIEHVIELQGLDDKKSFELAILQLKGNASPWFKRLKAKRNPVMTNAPTQVLIDSSGDVAASMMMNASKEMLGDVSCEVNSESEIEEEEVIIDTNLVMEALLPQMVQEEAGPRGKNKEMAPQPLSLEEKCSRESKQQDMPSPTLLACDEEVVSRLSVGRMVRVSKGKEGCAWSKPIKGLFTSNKECVLAAPKLLVEKGLLVPNHEHKTILGGGLKSTIMNCIDHDKTQTWALVSWLNMFGAVERDEGTLHVYKGKNEGGNADLGAPSIVACPRWTKCVWQGLNRRVFSKNSGYILTTPKLVPSSFSHCFKLRMLAGFVCLMAILAIRGLWLDGKGFKIDMEEENVVLDWLARGRHALGQSLMKGIKWDAILTFLLNNSLHRFNQGRWVHFVFNIEKKRWGLLLKDVLISSLKGRARGMFGVTKTQGLIKKDWSQVNCSKEMVGARGIHDTDQEMGNEIVIKKLGWIEEGESSKLVEKGEVFGMKGNLELRTILFQEGEDDPNGVKLNSDLKQAREFVTKHDEVARDQDGLGCGEAIWVTCHLFYQAWKYFKWSDKTGWNRDKGAWERYFGQGLKIMHVSCVLGFIQQLWDTMAWSNPDFLNAIRRVFRTLQDEDDGKGRKHFPRQGESRADYKAHEGAHEIHEFKGGTNPERYMEWERMIEHVIELQGLDDKKSFELAILQLKGNASPWFKRLKAKRSLERKEKISSWEALKKKLRRKYVPSTYTILSNQKRERWSVGSSITESAKKKLWLKTDPVMTNAPTQVLIDSSGDVAASMMMNASKEMLGDVSCEVNSESEIEEEEVNIDTNLVMEALLPQMVQEEADPRGKNKEMAPQPLSLEEKCSRESKQQDMPSPTLLACDEEVVSRLSVGRMVRVSKGKEGCAWSKPIKGLFTSNKECVLAAPKLLVEKGLLVPNHEHKTILGGGLKSTIMNCIDHDKTQTWAVVSCLNMFGAVERDEGTLHVYKGKNEGGNADLGAPSIVACPRWTKCVWQGLNRRVFSKNSGYILTTPKLVPSSFSHCFKLRMLAGFVCLMAILAIRGLWLDGKGFKIDMEEENVVLDWLARGRHALGQSLMKGIKWDAILTFLLNYSLHRFNQGRWVHFVFNIEKKRWGLLLKDVLISSLKGRARGMFGVTKTQGLIKKDWSQLNCSKEMVGARGIHDTDQEIGNEIVIKKLGWIEEGESSKLVEKGEVFGMKGTLELRTILFQEGEDDPNGVKLNSDLKQAREFVTKHDEVARDQDGLGCGEAIWVTCHLFYQAWKYFKWRDKTGWNRDKGAWERYFGQGLKIMHVNFGIQWLGAIQISSMQYVGYSELYKMKMMARAESISQGKEKVGQITRLVRGPMKYTNSKGEQIHNGLDDKKSFELAILQLKGNASPWFKRLKAKRSLERKEKISSWEALKKKLRRKYVPSTYTILSNQKRERWSVGSSISESARNKLWLKTDPVMTNAPTQVLIDSSGDVAASMMMNASKEMLGDVSCEVNSESEVEEDEVIIDTNLVMEALLPQMVQEEADPRGKNKEMAPQPLSLEEKCLRESKQQDMPSPTLLACDEEVVSRLSVGRMVRVSKGKEGCAWSKPIKGLFTSNKECVLAAPKLLVEKGLLVPNHEHKAILGGGLKSTIMNCIDHDKTQTWAVVSCLNMFGAVERDEGTLHAYKGKNEGGNADLGAPSIVACPRWTKCVWQGLNRRVFSKNSGYILTTPKLVPSSFSHSFKLRMLAGFVCLMAILAIRGLWLDGKGFKIDMEEENVVLDWLGRGRHALGQSLMKGITWDAILTFLLNNSLHRFNQGRWVHFVFNIEKKRSGGTSGGIHDTDQEMGNEIVIKKLGWIEEGESSKLVEKGEVFGMKGTLELRTILFQEGEDDPNGVKLNSDLKQAREFVTKHDEVARDQDGLGCGEAIWVTCHLFYQAWKYFKWRDKTGWNRDKGAWERYFGQGLKIMHVNFGIQWLGEIQISSMQYVGYSELYKMKMMARAESISQGKEKVGQITRLVRGPMKYTNSKGEQIHNGLDDKKSFELAILQLKGNASPWFKRLKAKRSLERKEKISSWEALKKKLRRKYVPSTYTILSNQKRERWSVGSSISESAKNKLWLKTDPVMTNAPTQVLIDSSGDVAASMMMNASKEMLGDVSCEVNSESEVEEDEVIIDTNLVMEALLPQMVQEEADPRGKNKEMAPQPLSLEEKCLRESKQQDMPSPTLLACDEEVVSRLSVGRMVRVSKGKEGCAWSKPIKGLFTSNKECVLAAPKLLVEKGLLVPNHEHKAILGGGLKSTIMNCIDHDKTQTWAVVSCLNMFGAVERDEGTLHAYKGKNEGGNADLGAPSIVACPRWTKCVWQGLNRRVFSKNSGYIFTTPKLVPSSFSHSFKLRMLAGFVCLMAILAIRGLWLDGKGFKIDMEEENVVLDWLGRGRHALGQSLMKGITWDAILTFLLNNSLHRFNQGRWVHFVFNIEKKRSGGTSGGIHDTDQEMGNEIVIKKLGWIEEVESSKLVEKGEVFGMKGTLELRTILFQEGEDDPNGVKLNSDLKQAREFVTKHDEVARDQDGLGCGEAIWVTCHLFYQAWKYFKWRDKTGWNRDKGAWERYFGQGLKIMHVSCVLGFIQQLWDTMAWRNPDFLNAIRRVFRTLQDEDDGKGRKHFPRQGESRADYKAREGAHEIHEFKGGTNPERYMEWERMIEHLIELQGLDDKKSFELAILQLKGNASPWFKRLKAKRSLERKEKISSWEALKKKLRRKYVPSTYTILSNQKRERWSVGSSITESAKKKLWLKTDPVMTNAPTQVLIDSSGDVAASMMMNASKEMLGDVSCEVNSESEVEEEEVIIDTNLVMEALLPQMVQEEADPRGKNKEMAPQPFSLEEKCSRESKQQDMPSPTLLACDEEVVSRLSVGRMVRVSKGKEGCAWSKPIKGLFTSNKECVLAAPKLLVEKGLLVPNHEHKTILGGGLKSTIMNCIDHDKTQTWAVVSCLNMFGAVERDEGTLHVYKGKNEGGNADLGAPSIVACPRWTKCVWQGLNRRVFSKNSGYILTTPKLVPSSFSHCFKLRMLAGFVCLMAILAIRGLWLDGKGFKIDMEEENVVFDWLARGRHALGQSLMKGIKWDAILTFLLNNSFNRFNQGRWVHFVFNIEKKRWGLLLKDVLISSLKGRARGMFGVTKTQGLIKKDWSQLNCSKEMVGARGIHDTDQEMGNEIVIKKLGWIEEGESSKLVEKGEVFGMKGTLELRTILFQEGEDDPNGVKLNSDLKQAREFVTKHDEVARDQDGLGCGEAIWVTCHLFYQAWKYFKWRDKTGWNRDKGAWERYFGQGLKIMHVNFGIQWLGAIQISSMQYVGYSELYKMKMMARAESISQGKEKVGQITRLGLMTRRVSLAILQLKGNASPWFKRLKAKRSLERKEKISSWEALKKKLRRKYVPSTYTILSNQKRESWSVGSSISESAKNKLWLKTDPVMTNAPTQVLIDSCGDVAASMMMNASKEMLGDVSCEVNSESEVEEDEVIIDTNLVMEALLPQMVQEDADPRGKNKEMAPQPLSLEEKCSRESKHQDMPSPTLLACDEEVVSRLSVGRMVRVSKGKEGCAWSKPIKGLFTSNKECVLAAPKLLVEKGLLVPNHEHKAILGGGLKSTIMNCIDHDKTQTWAVVSCLNMFGAVERDEGTLHAYKGKNEGGNADLGAPSIVACPRWTKCVWQGLNRRVFSKNSGYILTTPKLVPSRFSHSFKLRMLAGFVCLMAILAIRGLWLDGKGFKIDMFNQGRWVHFVFNIKKKRWGLLLKDVLISSLKGRARGIHDTDQEMGNEIVIKKLGWIEEGESSKLVEKGEVFGMKGTLELRTILFQEGEDDPNGVKLNSDLKQAREFVTKHDEVARDQDRLGCGEAIWVTCHLFYQAWKYFKWRDKTGWNRDKGAWERYFGQGLKIMHVSCVLGFIQQLWDTMAWSNPDFLNAIRRVFRTLQDEDDGKGRKHFPRQGESRADYKAREGAHEIHEFKGGTNPERYMEWERMIEHVIELQGLDDKKSFELDILQLKGNASPWFKRLKAKRSLERKEKISSWEALKKKLRRKYVPSTYISESAKNKLWLKIDPVMTNAPTQVLIDSSGDVAASMMMNASKEMLGDVSCEVNSESEVEEDEVIIDTNLVMEALLPQMVQEEADPRGKNKEMAPQPLSLEEKCSRESKQQDMPSPTLLACDEEVVSRLSVGRMMRVSKGKEGCAWSKPIKGLFTSNKECVLAAPKLLVEKGLLVPNHEHKAILGGGLKSTIMNCIDHNKTQTWAVVSCLNMFGAVERDEGTLHAYKGKNEGGNADLGAPSIVACPRWTKCVWQGLNRRVFSKNSGYILTTPKLVPSSFSYSFKLRMLAGFVCLMAILAIRGLWLDGKGFKIDMEEENVVLDWLARGRHALGQSLMKGIKWDAILTFLLNNSLHRSGGISGGIHDTDQEMGNEIVIKKLGWIEEGESSKLVEKGEVFGMKGTLELRTILFQEGEDDPNGVKLNSDLKQAREFVTKHDEVARDQDGLGCGEAIWVTCHLFYQAWKYFKWRDKTGWNRDKGAWERYFGQGLKIMHVSCVLGFIQQLWDTMAWSNPDFLNAIRRVFRTLQDEDDGKGRKHFPRQGESRADYKAREGAHEIHEFKGGKNPERYMEWERMIEHVIELQGLDDKKSFELDILQLKGNASPWFKRLKAKRSHERKEKISSWEALKKKLRRKYVPSTYTILSNQKRERWSVGSSISESAKNKLWLKIDPVMTNAPTQVLIDSSGDVAASMMMNASKEMLGDVSCEVNSESEVEEEKVIIDTNLVMEALLPQMVQEEADPRGKNKEMAPQPLSLEEKCSRESKQQDMQLVEKGLLVPNHEHKATLGGGLKSTIMNCIDHDKTQTWAVVSCLNMFGAVERDEGTLHAYKGKNEGGNADLGAPSIVACPRWTKCVWQGLNRRVFRKNSGYILTTPKLVPASFSHSFKLRMLAGFVCLMAILAIRGLWVDGKGFKIDMEEENVVLDWLARGRHALGFNQGRWVHFVFNIEKKRSGGIHDTDQEMGNEIVIKKLGWIEEGESSKLVEKGEVFGMKGPLELRTILFQEGEDDPNGVKLNSDLKQAREFVTKHDEVARDHDGLGCGEAIWVTCHLFYQAWKYYRWRDKTGWNRDRVHGNDILDKV